MAKKQRKKERRSQYHKEFKRGGKSDKAKRRIGSRKGKKFKL